MAIPRTTRRSSTAAPPAADAAHTRAAARAAELLDASEGVYALRKRTRSGAGLVDEAGRDGGLKKGVKKMSGKGADRGKGKGGTAPRKKAAATKRVAGKGRAKKGTEAPVEVSPVTTNESMSGLVAAAVAAAEQEDDDDDARADLSSLTSLSDDEADAAPDPLPASSSPRPSSLFLDDHDDPSADDDDDDDAFDPAHPNGSTSTRSSRKHSLDSRKSSASSTSSRLPRAAKATTAGRPASLSPVVEVPARKSKPGPNERTHIAAARAAAAAEPTAQATSAQRRTSTAAQLDSAVDPQATTARRASTDFRPLAMPTVVDLYDCRNFVLDQARVEATSDVMLQRRSENAVESAIEALETGPQQTALCLAMNRFSAWCGDQSVQIPVFPLTGAKLALFLARCTSTPLGSILLSMYPQPGAYPLPVADCLDANLTAAEGNRLTRELVKCWVDAFSYAQMATFDIWAPHIELMRHHQHGIAGGGAGYDPAEPHPSLRPLHEDRAVLEVLGALEPAAHMQRYEVHMRASMGGEAGGAQGLVVPMANGEEGGSSAGEMGPPSGTGKDKGKGRATEQGSERAPAAGSSAGGGSGKGKTKWVKGGKAVAPPLSLRGASSSSGTASHNVPPRSDPWTTATSPDLTAHSRPESTDWFSHVNAFGSAEPGSSFLEQAPTFASELGGEPTFATSFDEQYGEPFEPTSPRLHRRSSTSSLVLQSILDASAFPLPASAADALDPTAAAADMADSASHNASSFVVDESWRSSRGAPGRSRSVTHAARLENLSALPASGLDLAAPPAAQAQSSYLPVRFAARQVGQALVEQAAPPPPPAVRQQQQPPARAEPPRPQQPLQQQLQQSQHAPHFVDESHDGEQRFVPLQRAPKPARPVGRRRNGGPQLPPVEAPRRRVEQARFVDEPPYVAREQPHPVVEREPIRREPVEEYDPTRPQLDGCRLALPRPPASVSRLQQRRNAIVATPLSPEPDKPPSFVIVNGQRYELAPNSPPPPDPRFAPTIETRASREGAAQAMASFSGARSSRRPQGDVELRRSGPSHGYGYPPPREPDHLMAHDRFDAEPGYEATPQSSYREQPGARVPSWTIPRQAVEPDHFFAQLVSRAAPLHHDELERAHAAAPSLPPSRPQHPSAAQDYLLHPAYLNAHKAVSPPPCVDGPQGHVGALRSSCADKWRRAGPVGGGGGADGAPPLPSTAYPTPESPSGLFNGGEYPGIGPTTFVPLEGVVAAEIRSGPSAAALEPLRSAQVEGPVEGARRGGGTQESEPIAAVPMVGIGIGLG